MDSKDQSPIYKLSKQIITDENVGAYLEKHAESFEWMSKTLPQSNPDAQKLREMCLMISNKLKSNEKLQKEELLELVKFVKNDLLILKSQREVDADIVTEGLENYLQALEAQL